MAMENYIENKEVMQKIMRRLELHDPEKGRYLKEHVVFDNENRSFKYTGDMSLIASILSNAKVY